MRKWPETNTGDLVKAKMWFSYLQISRSRRSSIVILQSRYNQKRPETWHLLATSAYFVRLRLHRKPRVPFSKPAPNLWQPSLVRAIRSVLFLELFLPTSNHQSMYLVVGANGSFTLPGTWLFACIVLFMPSCAIFMGWLGLVVQGWRGSGEGSWWGLAVVFGPVLSQEHPRLEICITCQQYVTWFNKMSHSSHVSHYTCYARNLHS